jgi:hypothetical protein
LRQCQPDTPVPTDLVYAGNASEQAANGTDNTDNTDGFNGADVIGICGSPLPGMSSTSTRTWSQSHSFNVHTPQMRSSV